MAQFDDTMHFISRIQSAATPAEVCRHLVSVTSQFGLVNLIAGTMPDAGITREQQWGHVFLEGWPGDWTTRYIERDYVFVDPIIAFIRRTLQPFHWRDAPVLPGSEGVTHELFGEAGEHRLKAGFTVPLITLEGSIAAVSLGGEHVDIPPYAVGMVSLVATYAMGRAMHFVTAEASRQKAALSRRETECLKWAAEGKSEWEISRILGISEHTAARHLVNAKTKLGTSNRVHTIAEAIRIGIIS
jgi:LuxR family transcriptional regulator, quorum-sensing system regulator BjaR1